MQLRHPNLLLLAPDPSPLVDQQVTRKRREFRNVGTSSGLQYRLSQALRLVGAEALTRRTIARRRVSVLAYHDPEPEVFDAHMRFIECNYRMLSMSSLLAALEDGTWSAVPSRSVVITIDDGHKGNHRLLPVLERLPVKPTLYLCSQIVGTNRAFWPTLFPDRDALKSLPHHERLRVMHSRGFAQTDDRGDERRAALSREEIVDLLPFVEVGSHTRFHPILPMCEDDVAREEITESKLEIEGMTGRPCQHFCFPNGDFTERDQEMVKAAGYRSARTVSCGWVGPNSDPFALRVLGVSDVASVDQLAADLCGFRFVKQGLKRYWPGAAGRTPSRQ